ncbi:GNAT family N-acetyltransferase [Vibrio penaeicida]|uniref:GNAT family N-acetyltransferase n=1 Tax=Vibrio penaeicida TaxID=104609 RepID=UPI000CEA1827|nr:GNAT family protein [Vibrio penaeicida]
MKVHRAASDINVRSVRESDTTSLFKNYLGREETTQYLARKAFANEDEASVAIKKWSQSNLKTSSKIKVSVAECNQTSEVIGMLVFIFNGTHAEIHFGISPDHQNRGLATQLCLVGIEILKGSGISEIRTHPYVNHVASIRVLEKCGFVKSGVLSEHIVFPAMGKVYQDCADMRLHLKGSIPNAFSND